MKKLLSFLMALMMLALPVVGLAEDAADVDFLDEALANGRMVESAITFEVNASLGDESLDALVGDLLKALSLNVHEQTGENAQSGLRINLNGTDILTIDVATKGEDVYIYSDLLAGTTIVANASEAKAIVESFANLFVSMGAMTEADAKAFLDEVLPLLDAGEMPAMNLDLASMNFDFDAADFEALIESIAERAVEADPAAQPANSDPAVAAVTMNLTAEDIVAYYDKLLNVLESDASFMDMMSAMLVSGSGEAMDAAEAFNQLRSVISTEFPKMIEGDIPMTIYVDGNDELVALTCAMTVKNTESEAAETATVNVVYTRLTEADAVNHQIVATVESEGSVAATATIDAKEQGSLWNVVVNFAADDAVINIAVVAIEERSETLQTSSVDVDVTVTSEGETATVCVKVDEAAVKSGADVEKTTVIAISNDGETLFTVTVQSATADPAPSIATDDAVRLAALSEEEFQGWFVNVLNGLQTWLITAIQALPESLLGLLQ